MFLHLELRGGAPDAKNISLHIELRPRLIWKAKDLWAYGSLQRSPDILAGLSCHFLVDRRREDKEREENEGKVMLRKRRRKGLAPKGCIMYAPPPWNAVAPCIAGWLYVPVQLASDCSWPMASQCASVSQAFCQVYFQKGCMCVGLWRYDLEYNRNTLDTFQWWKSAIICCPATDATSSSNSMQFACDTIRFGTICKYLIRAPKQPV